MVLSLMMIRQRYPKLRIQVQLTNPPMYHIGQRIRMHLAIILILKRGPAEQGQLRRFEVQQAASGAEAHNEVLKQTMMRKVGFPRPCSISLVKELPHGAEVVSRKPTIPATSSQLQTHQHQLLLRQHLRA